MANTTQDILMSELLTDIGKLHELVASLQSQLPAQILEWNAAIQRFEAMRVGIQTSAAPACKDCRPSSDSLMLEVRSDLEAVTRECIEYEIGQPISKLIRLIHATKRRTWQITIAGFVAAQFGSLVCSEILRTEAYDPRIIALGQATMRAWGRLDNPCRGAINAALTQDR